jgi:hypothetical protein
MTTSKQSERIGWQWQWYVEPSAPPEQQPESELTGWKWADDHADALERGATAIGRALGMAIGVLLWVALIGVVVAAVAVPVWWLFLR